MPPVRQGKYLFLLTIGEIIHFSPIGTQEIYSINTVAYRSLDFFLVQSNLCEEGIEYQKL